MGTVNTLTSSLVSQLATFGVSRIVIDNGTSCPGLSFLTLTCLILLNKVSGTEEVLNTRNLYLYLLNRNEERTDYF